MGYETPQEFRMEWIGINQVNQKRGNEWRVLFLSCETERKRERKENEMGNDSPLEREMMAFKMISESNSKLGLKTS